MAVYQKRDKWFIDYYYQGRRVREAVGTSKKQADQALSTRKTEILQGRYHWLEEKRTVLFESLAKEYREYSKTNKRSWVRDGVSLDHFNALWAKRRATEITDREVERYKKQRLEAGAKPSTINRELTCLRHMLNMAVRWGRIPTNPVRGMRRLHEENCLTRTLSTDEERKLLAAANEPLKSILVTALHTGMRRGEILSLTWSAVDFGRNLITVVNPKNGRSRQIPLNEQVRGVLRARKQADGLHTFVFADTRSGRQIGSVKTAFLATLRRAGITGLRFHDLRHTFATRLVTQGVDLLTVKELLGHSSIAMTMRYAHPSERNLRRAVELLAPADGHHSDTKRKNAKRRNRAKSSN